MSQNQTLPSNNIISKLLMLKKHSFGKSKHTQFATESDEQYYLQHFFHSRLNEFSGLYAVQHKKVQPCLAL